MSRKQDFWEEHIRAWQTSGQTQTSYCREHRLALPSFGYWRRKLKATAGPATKGMVPIVPPATLGPVLIEIALRNGLTVRAPVSTEPARVAAWVRVLGTC